MIGKTVLSIAAILTIQEMTDSQQAIKDFYLNFLNIPIVDYPKNKEELKVFAGGARENGDAYENSSPLTAITAPHKIENYTTHIINGSDTLIIENFHCTGDAGAGGGEGDRGGDGAFFGVKGTSGAGGTVIIRHNAFVDVKLSCISVQDVDNIIIESNYFDHLYGGIFLKRFKRLDVKYNKFRNHGTYPHNDYVFAHVLSMSHTDDIEHIEVEYNLIDRTNAPYSVLPVPDDERRNYANAVDYINAIECHFVEGYKGKICNNILSGSEALGEVITGGGIVTDAGTKDFIIKGNIVLNASSYGIGSANPEGIELIGNVTYYSTLASKNVQSIYSTNSTDLHHSNPLSMVVYGGHDDNPIPLYMGYNKLYGNMCYQNFDGNKTEQSEGNSPIFGYSSFEDNEDKAKNHREEFLDLRSNNFVFCPPEEVSYRDYWGGLWKSPFVNTNNTGMETLTINEVYQLVYGLDYAEHVNTGNAMFEKWGTFTNSPKYFDEGRLA